MISQKVLGSSGYSYKTQNGVCKVTKGALVVMKATKQNGLYEIKGSVVLDLATLVSLKVKDQTTLWYRRLAHISEKGLMILKKQKLLGKDKPKKLEFCDDCMHRKMAKVKFKLAKHTLEAFLEYVH